MVCNMLNTQQFNVFLHSTLAYFQIFLEYERERTRLYRLQSDAMYLPSIQADENVLFDRVTKRLDEVWALIGPKGLAVAYTFTLSRLILDGGVS
jgi:hypothetical protein